MISLKKTCNAIFSIYPQSIDCSSMTWPWLKFKWPIEPLFDWPIQCVIISTWGMKVLLLSVDPGVRRTRIWFWMFFFSFCAYSIRFHSTYCAYRKSKLLWSIIWEGFTRKLFHFETSSQGTTTHVIQDNLFSSWVDLRNSQERKWYEG